MALDSLASVADLQAVGIDVTNTAMAQAFLAEASARVRDAAGCPISRVTSTVTFVGECGQRLPLPGPVSSVDTVELEGEAVTDWRLVDDALYRSSGWSAPTLVGPPTVRVTFTHGLAEVPADIVGLVRSLVAAGMAAAEDGNLGRDARVVGFGIDDYRENLRQDGGAATAMDLPEGTRAWLRERFSTGVFVL